MKQKLNLSYLHQYYCLMIKQSNYMINNKKIVQNMLDVAMIHLVNNVFQIVTCYKTGTFFPLKDKADQIISIILLTLFHLLTKTMYFIIHIVKFK